MEAKQTSLIDLLERIPQGARLVVEHDQFSSSSHPVGRLCHEAAAALRAALAQQDEPVWMHPWPPVRAQQAEPQTIDEAMRLPRAMAQAYENGYKAGEAHERERCLRLIDDHVRAVDSEDVVRAIKEVQG